MSSACRYTELPKSGRHAHVSGSAKYLVLGLIGEFGPRWLDNLHLSLFDALRSFAGIIWALSIIALPDPAAFPCRSRHRTDGRLPVHTGTRDRRPSPPVETRLSFPGMGFARHTRLGVSATVAITTGRTGRHACWVSYRCYLPSPRRIMSAASASTWQPSRRSASSVFSVQ